MPVQQPDQGSMYELAHELPPLKPEPLPFWTVAVYLADQSYGGPEEGGWWYNTGERVDHPLDGIPVNHLLQVFTSEETARVGARVLQAALNNSINVGRRSKTSVMSGGVYEAEVYNGHPPVRYPLQRPHYE